MDNDDWLNQFDKHFDSSLNIKSPIKQQNITNPIELDKSTLNIRKSKVVNPVANLAIQHNKSLPKSNPLPTSNTSSGAISSTAKPNEPSKAQIPLHYPVNKPSNLPSSNPAANINNNPINEHASHLVPDIPFKPIPSSRNKLAEQKLSLSDRIKLKKQRMANNPSSSNEDISNPQTSNKISNTSSIPIPTSSDLWDTNNSWNKSVTVKSPESPNPFKTVDKIPRHSPPSNLWENASNWDSIDYTKDDNKLTKNDSTIEKYSIKMESKAKRAASTEKASVKPEGEPAKSKLVNEPVKSADSTFITTSTNSKHFSVSDSHKSSTTTTRPNQLVLPKSPNELKSPRTAELIKTLPVRAANERHANTFNSPADNSSKTVVDQIEHNVQYSPLKAEHSKPLPAKPNYSANETESSKKLPVDITPTIGFSKRESVVMQPKAEVKKPDLWDTNWTVPNHDSNSNPVIPDLWDNTLDTITDGPDIFNNDSSFVPHTSNHRTSVKSNSSVRSTHSTISPPHHTSASRMNSLEAFHEYVIDNSPDLDQDIHAKVTNSSKELFSHDVTDMEDNDKYNTIINPNAALPKPINVVSDPLDVAFDTQYDEYSNTQLNNDNPFNSIESESGKVLHQSIWNIDGGDTIDSLNNVTKRDTIADHIDQYVDEDRLDQEDEQTDQEKATKSEEETEQNYDEQEQLEEENKVFEEQVLEEQNQINHVFEEQPKFDDYLNIYQDETMIDSDTVLGDSSNTQQQNGENKIAEQYDQAYYEYDGNNAPEGLEHQGFNGLLDQQEFNGSTDQKVHAEYPTDHNEHPEYPTEPDQQEYPAYTADQQEYPEYSADQQEYPEYSADQQEYPEHPKDQQEYPEYIADQQEYPEYPKDQQEYPEYTADQQEYPAYTADQLEYPEYTADQQDYPAEPEHQDYTEYPADQQDYPAEPDQLEYPEYTADQQEYPEYPKDQQEYPEYQNPSQFQSNWIDDVDYSNDTTDYTGNNATENEHEHQEYQSSWIAHENNNNTDHNTCSNCKFNNIKNAKFCCECGTRLVAVITASTPAIPPITKVPTSRISKASVLESKEPAPESKLYAPLSGLLSIFNPLGNCISISKKIKALSVDSLLHANARNTVLLLQKGVNNKSISDYIKSKSASNNTNSPYNLLYTLISSSIASNKSLYATITDYFKSATISITNPLFNQCTMLILNNNKLAASQLLIKNSYYVYGLMVDRDMLPKILASGMKMPAQLDANDSSVTVFHFLLLLMNNYPTDAVKLLLADARNTSAASDIKLLAASVIKISLLYNSTDAVSEFIKDLNEEYYFLMGILSNKMSIRMDDEGIVVGMIVDSLTNTPPTPTSATSATAPIPAVSNIGPWLIYAAYHLLECGYVKECTIMIEYLNRNQNRLVIGAVASSRMNRLMGILKYKNNGIKESIYNKLEVLISGSDEERMGYYEVVQVERGIQGHQAQQTKGNQKPVYHLSQAQPVAQVQPVTQAQPVAQVQPVTQAQPVNVYQNKMPQMPNQAQLPQQFLSGAQTSAEVPPSPIIEQAQQIVENTEQDVDVDDEKNEKDEKAGYFSTLKGIFSFGAGNKDTATKVKPVNADLGEKSSFYYDEKLQKWVNPNVTLTNVD
eukprot:NODE_14_length_42432_cov_0.433799.p1 type:complete len:1608 gc:universal NODE_14_length_42432_cov_0.433799:16690-11867(-)